jgi:flagellar biosynthesis anti-sigma factor FlgM
MPRSAAKNGIKRWDRGWFTNRLKLSNYLPILKLQGNTEEEGVMRIDLSNSIQQTLDPAGSANSTRTSSQSKATDSAADVTKLSPEYEKVQSLAASVSQVPEMRQERVAALSESIRAGNYGVSSKQTAEALLSYMSGTAA